MTVTYTEKATGESTYAHGYLGSTTLTIQTIDLGCVTVEWKPKIRVYYSISKSTPYEWSETRTTKTGTIRTVTWSNGDVDVYVDIQTNTSTKEGTYNKTESSGYFEDFDAEVDVLEFNVKP